MWMSPVLQTLQFNWGLTPFTFCKDSNIDGVGFFLKKVLLYTSTGTGLLDFETGFRVPEITISSKKSSSFKLKFWMIFWFPVSFIFIDLDLNPTLLAISV